MCQDSSRKTWILSAALILVILALLYAWKELIELRVRVALAEEQVEVFIDMLEESRGSSATEMNQRMEYAGNYYPSGTKQIPGSALDVLVENVRSHVLADFSILLEEKGNRKRAPAENE